MKSLPNLLALLLVVFAAINYSCNNDDDDPQGCDYYTETNDELQAVTDAANAYAADPQNPAKCQAYVDAYQNYLNELEDHVECAALSGQQDELQDAIDSAQASLNQLQC